MSRVQFKAGKVANNDEAATNCVYIFQGDFERIFRGNTTSPFLKVPGGLVYMAK